MNKSTTVRTSTPSRRNQYVQERDSREQRIMGQWLAATKPAEIVRDEDGMIFWAGGAK